MIIVGQHDDKTVAQLEDVATRAVRVALMADGHLGYWMPIGGVAAFDNMVSTTGVGFDIACGNCAYRLDARHEDLTQGHLLYLADWIQDHFAFGVGGINLAVTAPHDHEVFDNAAWTLYPHGVRQSLKDNARNQLGTIGSGNHYVDIFVDGDGWLWVGVHFGSRGLGHRTCTMFTNIANGRSWDEKLVPNDNPGGLMSLDSAAGLDYWVTMKLAGQYAYAGREWVCREVANMLQAQVTDVVHNNHNFAWKEGHGGQEYVVVRKGATPAWPNQRGFVGGSMGDPSVILRGNIAGAYATPGGEEVLQKQKDLMFSTVHGAGRVMGRMQARGKQAKDGTWKREPGIRQEEMDAWVAAMGVIRRGGDVDEAPQAYRRLRNVLAAQGDTIVVERTLTPLIAVMAERDRR